MLFDNGLAKRLSDSWDMVPTALTLSDNGNSCIPNAHADNVRKILGNILPVNRKRSHVRQASLGSIVPTHNASWAQWQVRYSPGTGPHDTGACWRSPGILDR